MKFMYWEHNLQSISDFDLEKGTPNARKQPCFNKIWHIPQLFCMLEYRFQIDLKNKSQIQFLSNTLIDRYIWLDLTIVRHINNK